VKARNIGAPQQAGEGASERGRAQEDGDALVELEWRYKGGCEEDGRGREAALTKAKQEAADGEAGIVCGEALR
jgi:hypothetical protein